MQGDHDAEVMAGLANVAKDQWDRLWAAADAVAGETAHAVPAGGTSARSGEPGQMPYLVYSDNVIALIQAIEAAHLVVPFDWMGWNCERRYPDTASLSTASLTDAVRVITATIRAERFADGAVNAALTNGILPAALMRVRRWASGEDERPR